MAAFPLRSSVALVRMQAQAVQASLGRIVNFGIGSTARGLIDANTGVALWMQWLMVLLLRRTRASTSTGSDLDSFMADFGVVRLPASFASGALTFGRLSVGQTGFIAPGSTMRTADGQTLFTVGTDVTNPAWSGLGYTIGAAQVSITVAATAAVAGAAGNVTAGSVSLISAALPGVDTVTNLAPFGGGVDPENDAALRARFILFVNSRSRGTRDAVAYAVTSYAQGLAYSIAENQAPDGSVARGFFTVTVDDGSGNPPSSLLSVLYSAIDAIRPVGSAFAVVAPVPVVATISLTVTAGAGYPKATLVGPVATAILAYVNTLSIGAALPYSRLAQLAYTVPGVVNVTAILLNGAALDIGGAPAQVVRATVSTVSIG